LLQYTEERRAFFRELSRPPINPSSGYRYLLQLMATRRVRTVLTTNFDTVLPALADTVPNPRRLTTICSPDDYRYLSTAPTQPQVIYLYGDAERYADRYFAGGYERLDEDLIEHLIPLLRDHPLIVIGYSGGELSVMNNLLLENAPRTYYYRHGLYWCVLRSEYPDNIHPLVTQLSDAVGLNFHFVPIDSFDDLMDTLLQASRQIPTSLPVVTPERQALPTTFDMQMVPGATLDDLEWSDVQARLVAYCRRMDIPVPGPVTHDWLVEQMLSLDLARADGDIIRPTVAGYLLLGKRSTDRLPTARVEVHISGEEPVVLTGNLWQQLRVIDLLESEFNIPFRLKGRNSETVTPYPPLALKEVIVNALAHRRYDGEATEAVTIRVEPDHITVTSPGGLHETAHRQLPPDIPPEEALGTRSIKGYRNPVIADFLYSSGEMDKLGSGLVDVRKWVRQNGGDVRFRLGPGDTFFEVALYRRPETPDASTGAASPLTLTGEFISNVLEVVELPTVVWSDKTRYRRVPQILYQSQGQPLPAFVPYEGRLYTFSDLSRSDNPLRRFTRGTDTRPMPLTDFAAGEVGERRLVNLLNEALRNFVESKGLIFDWKRKRAYFPRTDDGERVITYQARLRQATRTVVKARISSSTNRVIYWEHQALEFRFKRFGETWGLQLLPTYVFTRDGFYERLPSKQSGPLTTRRLSREYNVHVDNHLVFWTAFLSNGAPDIVLEDAFGSRTRLRGAPVTCVLHALEPQPEGEELLPSEEELDELEEQLWDLMGEDDEEEDVTDDDTDN